MARRKRTHTDVTATPQDDALIDETEAARRLGIAARALKAIRLLRPTQGPPFVRIGSMVRYSPATIRAWLEAQESAGG